MTEDHENYDYDDAEHHIECECIKHASPEQAARVELAMFAVQQHAQMLMISQLAVDGMDVLVHALDEDTDENGQPYEVLRDKALETHNAGMVDFAAACRAYVKEFESAYGELDEVITQRWDRLKSEAGSNLAGLIGRIMEANGSYEPEDLDDALAGNGLPSREEFMADVNELLRKMGEG